MPFPQGGLEVDSPWLAGEKLPVFRVAEDLGDFPISNVFGAFSMTAVEAAPIIALAIICDQFVKIVAVAVRRPSRLLLKESL